MSTQSMHVLYEDDGEFRAATILAPGDASMQVELPGGKRAKVKASHVLLRFATPAPARLLEQARGESEAIDLDFLWECAPQRDFGFEELAQEYFGAVAAPVQAVALLLRLHGAPVYFHRKGRGRYRPAPPEILRAALAAVERKRVQEALRQAYVAELVAGGLPPVLGEQAMSLLVNPDRNRIETKALEQAAAELHTTPLRLMLARGAVPSPWHWHVESFLREHFPRGTGFPSGLPLPGAPDAALPLRSLPLAAVRAFSVDDSTTTEIDDAISTTPLGDGRVRVGIHIAAPALGIVRDGAVDAVARNRMSTVYGPGLKFTMLPPPWVAAFSLDAGHEVAVVSLYVDVDAAGEMLPGSAVTRVERLCVAANLRHDLLDSQVTAEALAAAPELLPVHVPPTPGPDATADAPAGNGAGGVPFLAELGFLWRFARNLLAQRERVRGRPEPLGRTDWSFAVDGEGPDAEVKLQARRRGAPLDLIVAELMILVNSTWGGWLAERQVPAIYRSQTRTAGVSRVRMGTAPLRHDGIGVSCYAWSTSPLRRYVDLVNQRQIIAAACGDPPPYRPQETDLFAIVQGFESAHAVYGDFEDRMQRYWALRWLQRQGLRRLTGVVLRDELVRLEELPWVGRVTGLPQLARGRKVVLEVRGDDELELRLDLALVEVLPDEPAGTLAAAEPDPEDEDEPAPDSDAAPAEVPGDGAGPSVADPASISSSAPAGANPASGEGVPA